MKHVKRWRLLAAGAVVVLTNALVLAGAAWNRSGEPLSSLLLSERELTRSYEHATEDDSGLALSLRWRVPVSVCCGDDCPEDSVYGARYYARNAAWLDTDKLAALGFDVGDVSESKEAVHSPDAVRTVWLVLEFNGASYQESLDNAAHALSRAEQLLAEQPTLQERQENLQRAREAWKQARDQHSRLFVIDAGLDAAALQARYGDRKQHAVVRGRVSARWQPPASPGDRGGWHSQVQAIDVENIHVPRQFHNAVSLARDDSRHRATQRYTVDLRYGQRHEPWIAAISGRLPEAVVDEPVAEPRPANKGQTGG